MTYDATEVMAMAVARAQPDDHGRSFFPPIVWGLNSYGNLFVIGADGRKVIYTMEQIKELLPAAKPHPVKNDNPVGAARFFGHHQLSVQHVQKAHQTVQPRVSFFGQHFIQTDSMQF